MRVRRLVSVGVALTLLAGLITAVTIVVLQHPGPPVQVTGTAAGLPHRVPAAVTLGQAANGHSASASGPGTSPSSGSGQPGFIGPALSRGGGSLPGTVPPATQPKPVRLPVQGKPPQQSATALPAPAPVKKAGYDPATSHQARPASANQLVYVNADGTKTAFSYQSPVNYQRADGTWVTASSTLVPNATQVPSISSAPAASDTAPPPDTSSGSPSPAPADATPPAAGWTEQSQAQPQSFAAYANAPDLVTMPVDASHAVAFGVAGAAAVPGAAQGNSVGYQDVRSAASIDFTAGTGLVKEQIVLSSAAAPATWVFPLDLTGLQARMGADGDIQFADGAGLVLAYVPHGFMADANIDPHSGDGVMSDGVSYALITYQGGPAIQMTLDATWLGSADRVFPVTVDPSILTVPRVSTGTTYVEYPLANDNSSASEIKAGTYNGGTNKAKSFLAFTDVGSTLTNDKVLGARLDLYNSWSYSCQARPVYVYPVTASWPVSGSKSWPGPSTGAAIGSASFAAGWTPVGGGASPCGPKWESVVLSQAGTDLINGWTHGAANNGLAVGASASDSYGWKKFASYNIASGKPTLEITYSPDGADYKLAASKPVTQVTPTQDGVIALYVRNTGATTWTPTNGYQISYRAYGADKKPVPNYHPPFTVMPQTIGPNSGWVKVNVNVGKLPAGVYALDFDMYSGTSGSSPVAFSSEGVQQFPVALNVPQPPPTVSAVYPPTGYVSPTLAPQLSTVAAAGSGTITYSFTVTCEALPDQNCTDPTPSGNISKPYWTVPRNQMQWNMPYQWSVTATVNGASTTVGPMSLTPEVPQPAITSGLGGGGTRAYAPLSGNYTTSATDAAVAVAGPPLQVTRSYNSLDPRTSGAFGAGWSAITDIAVQADNDGTGNMTVTLPDGQQMRFGKNGDGSYLPAYGSKDALVHNADGTWSLRDPTGTRYDFTPAGVISAITDAHGLVESFTTNGPEVTGITDATSGRTLTIAWGPGGANISPHVTSVTTQAPAGLPALQWTYNYAGDQLTSACAPTGCTQYSYTSGSLYYASVLDSRPLSYWQLGEGSGSHQAADEVDANLGTTDGSYTSMGNLGSDAGPLAGSSETAARFNGTSSYLSLPANQMLDSTDTAIELWFKTSSNGVLFSYAADPLSNASGNNDHHVPALYVGTDGKLYGELWNGTTNPMVSSGTVTDGNWHYAVLTGSGNSQSLYLDGIQQGSSLPGQIDQGNAPYDTVGAGFWQGAWPHAGTGAGTTIGYFTGDIAQVALYPHPLGSAAISAHWALHMAASAQMTSITLPSGNTYESATYDPSTGRIDTYSSPDNGLWTIGQPLASGNKATSEAAGQVIDHVTVTGPASTQQTYGFDMLNGGRLVSYDNGVDPPEFYGYTAAGFLSEVLDQDQSLVCIASDSHGRVDARTWHTAAWPVYVNGQVPTDGSVIQFGDGTAIPTCTAQTTSSPDCATPLATNPAADRTCTTFYNYAPYTDPLDPRNNEPVSLRDARSASPADNTYLTSYGYNSAGELLTQQTPATSDFPNRRTTSYAYTVSTTPAYGGGTAPVGLLKTATTPAGAVLAYQYDALGDLRQVTEPSGRITVYTYDALGRLLTKTVTSSPSPAAETDYAYTAGGQLATVTYPGVLNQVTGVTHTRQDTYSYDVDGHVHTLTVSDTTGGDPSRTTTYNYDDPDHPARITSQVDPGGVTTGGTAQSDGSASADPLGATTAFEYDELGNIIKQTDPSGNDYLYTYNEYNQLTQTTLVSSVQASRTPNCSAPATVDSDGQCDLVLESRAYSPAGVLASVTDAMGRTTAYSRDRNRDLTSVTTCTGASDATCTAPGASITSQASYTYDGDGNLISQAVTGQGQPGSTVTSYTVDAASRVTSEAIDPTPSRTSSSGYANRTVSFTYDADNHVQTQTAGSAASGGSSLISYAYDPAGTLHSQTVQDTGGPAASLTTTWQYDQYGQPVLMTSPRGNVTGATAANYTTSYAYDLAGRLVTQTEPSVSVQDYANQAATAATPTTTSGYDTFGDLTQVKDPNGGVTSAAYDGGGRVTSVTSASYTPPGASAITATTGYGYDEVGDLTQVTDPKGNVACYSYDALGDVTSASTPAQPSTQPCSTTAWTYGYDADGEQLSATDPYAKKWQATYDYFGNQSTATDPLTHTTSYAHDYLGDLVTTTTPSNVVTSATFDHLGDLTSTTDGAGNTTSYQYGYLGQQTNALRPDGGVTKYGYDEAGYLTSQVDYTAAPAGQATVPVRSLAFGRDPDGNLTSATDGRGNTTTWSYNAASAITSQVVPVSSSASVTTSYGYDRAGNQTAITGGNGATTWTTYNSWNLPESVVKPATPAAPSAANRTWTTAYDANGLAATVSQPGGISLSYGYDPLGNLTSESGSGAAAPTAAQALTYDLDGRLASATAPGGTDSFTYYDNGNLQQATGPSGSSSFSYNPDGLVSSVTGHGGTTSYGYDGADRLSTLADPLTGATLTYGYNADSLPASIGYSIAGASGPAQTFGYDSLQRLTSQTVKSASGSTLASQAYAYDAAGNMTSQSTGGLMAAGTTTYAYDQANRLASSTISGTTTTYGYDGDGNLTASGGTSYAYNAQDQVTSSTTTAGTTSYGYTLAGALASVTPPGGSAQSYTTDAYGWLATAPNGISYGYDALGRLAARTVGATTASMSYLGTSGTLAFDGSRNYTYDPAGNVDATQVPGGSAFTTMSNAHGDLAATFSPTSTAGGLAGYATYAPYGTRSASGYGTDVNYQGDYTDPSTHQVMMGARWYAPATGSFATSDTIAGMPLPSTMDGNPYAYTSGSPLVQTDPTGHWDNPEPAGITLGAVIGIIASQYLPVVATVGEILGGASLLAGADVALTPTPTGGNDTCAITCSADYSYSGADYWAYPGSEGLGDLGEGAASCGLACAPPPQPRDCIQAGTCPFGAKSTKPVETRKTFEDKDWKTLGCPAHCIQQQPTRHTGPVIGAHPLAAGDLGDTSTADLDKLIQDIIEIGQPESPGNPTGGVPPADNGPTPQTATGGSGNMQGGGPPSAGTGGACDPAGDDPIENYLNDVMTQVLGMWRDADVNFSSKAYLAAQSNPDMWNTLKGTPLDGKAKSIIFDDANQGHPIAQRLETAGPRVHAPDVRNMSDIPGTADWYDFTTPGSWARHLKTYPEYKWGRGKPIYWPDLEADLGPC